MLDFSLSFDYDTSRLFVDSLTHEYNFLRPAVIGRTYTGRGIFSMSLGNELNSVLIVGGIHGCETITCLLIYKYLDLLCKAIRDNGLVSYVRIANLMDKFGVTFIPCLNPDGAEIASHGLDGAGNMKHITEKIECSDYSLWKSNALGVDINCNFDTNWKEGRLLQADNGIFSSSPAQFGGFSPESEPETKAICELCRRKKFRTATALFAQGEEICSSSFGKEPVKSSMMAKILACSCGYGVTDDNLYAGFKDWFISEFSKPAFTFKIGSDKNSLSVSQLDRLYSRLEEALTLLLLM